MKVYVYSEEKRTHVVIKHDNGRYKYVWDPNARNVAEIVEGLEAGLWGVVYSTVNINNAFNTGISFDAFTEWQPYQSQTLDQPQTLEQPYEIENNLAFLLKTIRSR